MSSSPFGPTSPRTTLVASGVLSTDFLGKLISQPAVLSVSERRSRAATRASTASINLARSFSTVLSISADQRALFHGSDELGIGLGDGDGEPFGPAPGDGQLLLWVS